MMGGLRCGKTSVLVAMFDQMMNGWINQFFSVFDNTSYDMREKSLSAKSLELQYILETFRDNTFLLDIGPSQFIWKYILKLLIPGTNINMNLDFLDVPGSFFDIGLHYEEMIRLVSESDVYIINVDTPYLMADGVSTALFRAVNRLNEIYSLLTNLPENKARMVIIAPVKSEKWMKENRIDEVVERIELAYAETINVLKSYSKMSLCIIPVQTIGNILFSEMKDAYFFNGCGNENRCCKISDNVVRMWNGEYYCVNAEDQIYPDNNALITNTSIARPFSWFCINGEMRYSDDIYQPYNCEQLTLHILDFWLQKCHNFFVNWVMGPPRDFIEIEKTFCAIKNAGLLKENVEGIKYLKKTYK